MSFLPSQTRVLSRCPADPERRARALLPPRRRRPPACLLLHSLGGLLCAALVAACSDGTGPKLVTGAGTWVSLTAAGAYTCGLTRGGAAYCWGDNGSGSLGDGSTTNRPTPVAVAGGIGLASLYHSCGLTSSGAAYCWGNNYYGQVGDGSTTDRSTPVAVAGGLRFASLTAGGDVTCGVTSSGAAFCWGLNHYGELGDGSTTDRPTPVAVAGRLTFASLTAGGFHTCGATTSGAVYCWGDNEFGQLGLNSIPPYSSAMPVAVATGLRFASLTAGSAHTCGLTSAGAAYCWGLNTDGQLGDGSNDASTANVHSTPVAVVGGLTFTSLTAGSDYTCGVTSSGAAYCWGANYYGQLGDGSMTVRPAPVAVAGGLTFANLTAGAYHTCGVTSGGAAYCWGSDGSGELGDGLGASETESHTPVAVAGGLTFVSVTAGYWHACGVTSGGGAYCWGQNQYGALGDGSTTDRSVPLAVAGGVSFTSLTGGGNHTCGLTSGGAAYCWGYNFLGQLGDGSTTDRTTPVAVAGGLTFASLAAGYWYTCGVTSGGAAYCWGNDGASQLGDSSYIDRSTPVAVRGGLTFASLAAGGEHACGVTSSGAAYCWGANNAGQLGDGSHDTLTLTSGFKPHTPVAVAGGLNFASLAAGWDHTCGVTSSGAAYCWGENLAGGLGAGLGFDFSPTPVAVAGGLTFANLTGGEQHTCGVTSSGAAYCWGANPDGVLGDGSTAFDRSAPEAVAGGLTFARLTTGAQHTCGLTTGGAAYCWGANGYGQLGDGLRMWHLTPVAVANP